MTTAFQLDFQLDWLASYTTVDRDYITAWVQLLTVTLNVCRALYIGVRNILTEFYEKGEGLARYTQTYLHIIFWPNSYCTYTYFCLTILSCVSRSEEVERDLSTSLATQKQELTHANDLLTSIRHRGASLSKHEILSLSPAAAQASALLKSGKSLTQIYSEHIQAS